MAASPSSGNSSSSSEEEARRISKRQRRLPQPAAGARPRAPAAQLPPAARRLPLQKLQLGGGSVGIEQGRTAAHRMDPQSATAAAAAGAAADQDINTASRQWPLLPDMFRQQPVAIGGAAGTAQGQVRPGAAASQAVRGNTGSSSRHLVMW
jgi:hypothetical protein